MKSPFGDLIIDLKDIVAMEASTNVAKLDPSVMANRETNPSMKIALLTDKVITNAKLKCVTSPIMFTNGTDFYDDGIFSTKIFGETADQRKRQCGYIDLHQKFFHPFVFEILCKLDQKFGICASGKGSWIITPEGKLLEIKDENDPLYNEENTGLNWLIKNYDKLSFKTNTSVSRNDRVQMIKSLSKDEIFIQKWIVIPVFYRDVDLSNDKKVIPELNKMYNKLIQYSNGIPDSSFAFFNNGLCYSIQSLLVDIRKYGQSLIEKKHGFFHKAILGKSTDFGSRDVISVPVMNRYETPMQNPVDIMHTGIPVTKCLALAYPFIKKYCLDFFANNFRNAKEYPVYRWVDGKYKIVAKVNIKDQMQIYTAQMIDKKIERYMKSPGTRFETINIITEDDKEIPMYFSGLLRPMPGVDLKKYSTSLYQRPMTWADLFYQASMEVAADKYVYITRYPVTSYASIFPSKCTPLSTLNTMPLEVDGKFYPNYPVIDLSLSTDKISTLFIDTVTMSNLFLDALGGDYDGDTVSCKLCFSLEANKEAEEIAESIRSFVSPDGKLMRMIKNEGYLSFYNMTRHDETGHGVIPADKKKLLLGLKKEEMTVDLITSLFSNTTKMSEGSKKTFEVKPPVIDTQWKLHLDAGEYINKEAVETTAGIFLFNKLIVEGDLEKITPNGYYNETLNKKKFSAFLNYVAAGIMNGKIPIKPTVYNFLRDYEFWALKLVTIFSPSYTSALVTPSKRLTDEKQKLLNDNKNASTAEMVEIRDKLLDVARDTIKGDPGKTLFDSGSRGSFENDFGNMFVAVGPVENPVTGNFDFMKSNYISGISKEDLVAAGNIIVNAEYPKAIGTAKGGYQTKQFNAVFQTVTLGPKDSDCGTKGALTITLTKDNLSKYIDQYIAMPNGATKLITEDLDIKYMNHPIKVRSPMYCLHLDQGDAICNKCAGERFYKLGVSSMGLTASDLSAQMMNASLKLRHSLQVEMNKIDIDKIIK